MPSASTKPDVKASQEAIDPIKQALNVVDKKVRNLEKRKGKLDAYKDKANQGTPLEPDQLEAVAKYGEVVQNLEFARELQKQFMGISADADKFQKKQAKRDKLERAAADARKVRETLLVQNVLDSMGSDEAQEDFKTGKHGAVELKESELSALDDLYKLISPTRGEGETAFEDQLTQAADHITALLDGKDKEVAGTTYRTIKEVIDKIGGCGYFDRAPAAEETEEAAATEETSAEETPAAPGEGEFVVVQTADVPEHDSHEVAASLPPTQELPSEPSQSVESAEFTASADTHTPAQDQPLHTQVAEGFPVQEDSSFYSAPQVPAPTQQTQQPEAQKVRPFQEIVSSVQGNFNFLQESTIELDQGHMSDPAVVAAHPMVPLSQEASLAYEVSGLLSEPQVTQDTASPAQQPLPTHQAPTAYTPEGPSYSHMASDAPPHPAYTAPAPSADTQQAGFPGAEPLAAGQQQDGPPQPIPLPGEDSTPQTQQQHAQHDTQESKKPYSLDPNAAMFQSMYSAGGAPDGQHDQQYPAGQDGGFSQQQDFQGSGGFGGGYRGNNQRGGGRQQGNQRGGPRGERGVSNGYSGRGRGGGSAPYNSGPRGGFQNSRGNSNSRGGPRDYQGYPPRQDYRPEGGYQGYSNSYNNTGGGYGGQRQPRGGQGQGRGGQGMGRGGQGNRRGGYQGGQRGGNQSYGQQRPNQVQASA